MPHLHRALPFLRAGILLATLSPLFAQPQGVPAKMRVHAYAFDDWTWTEGRFVARRAPGQVITIRSFTPDSVIIDRKDANGSTGVYTGKIAADGGAMYGTITFEWPGHANYPNTTTFTGVWDHVPKFEDQFKALDAQSRGERVILRADVLAAQERLIARDRQNAQQQRMPPPDPRAALGILGLIDDLIYGGGPSESSNDREVAERNATLRQRAEDRMMEQRRAEERRERH